MSIQDLGAIGESVSSIAVVISLIYLAVQIRENTRTQRITAAQDVMSLSATNNTNLLVNPQLSDVLTKVNAASESLSPRETTQYRVFLMSVFAANLQVHFLHDNGLLDDEIFEMYERRTRDVLARPVARQWWEANEFRFTESYQRHVDSVIAPGA